MKYLSKLKIKIQKGIYPDPIVFQKSSFPRHPVMIHSNVPKRPINAPKLPPTRTATIERRHHHNSTTVRQHTNKQQMVSHTKHLPIEVKHCWYLEIQLTKALATARPGGVEPRPAIARIAWRVAKCATRVPEKAANHAHGKAGAAHNRPRTWREKREAAKRESGERCISGLTLKDTIWSHTNIKT